MAVIVHGMFFYFFFSFVFLGFYRRKENSLVLLDHFGQREKPYKPSVGLLLLHGATYLEDLLDVFLEGLDL